MNLHTPKINLSRFPINFKVLFAFQGKYCKCHNLRLNLKNILEKHPDIQYNS